jgi:hypothetical protein
MTEEQAKRHGIGMALLLLAKSDAAKAYLIFKATWACA